MSTVLFTIDPDAIAPPELWPRLTAKHSKAMEVFENTYPGQKDRTPEGWDAELAFLAISEHWSEQEIVDLLIAHRRSQGYGLQDVNSAYFSRVIYVAHTRATESSIKHSRAEKELAKNKAIKEQFKENDPRRDISLMLGFQIFSIKRFIQDPPMYALVTSTKEFEIGDVTNLIKQMKLREQVAAYLGHYIPLIKPQDWQELAQLLLDICEDIKVAPESTNRGRIKLWIEEYLQDKEPVGNDE